VVRSQPGRFQSKNNAKVAYGEKLDLAPYMANLPLDSRSVWYTLYGVVVHLDHMNSTTFGHYVSYVRTSDGRWFDCDDTQVRFLCQMICVYFFWPANSSSRSPSLFPLFLIVILEVVG
jgi:ubiquitin C-terminal hydrolase